MVLGAISAPNSILNINWLTTYIFPCSFETYTADNIPMHSYNSCALSDCGAASKTIDLLCCIIAFMFCIPCSFSINDIWSYFKFRIYLPVRIYWQINLSWYIEIANTFLVQKHDSFTCLGIYDNRAIATLVSIHILEYSEK